jgi:phage-related protein
LAIDRKFFSKKYNAVNFVAMNIQRQIIFHKHYFLDFYLEQTEKVQEKIEYVFKIIRTVQNVPKKFLYHMPGTVGLYEIRIEFESNIYRIFCCFDKENLVVLFNGFQKKMQKTPRKEIEFALKLKDEYFNLKNKSNG